MQVTFDHSHNEADNITTFYFKPQKPLYYTAGQYTELALQHPRADLRGSRRWFTLSSSPSDEFLTITTKFTPADGSSFKKALHKLQPDTELTMAAPMGDFVLPKLIQTPLIFVAGGIGITPFHSMLSWLATTGESRPITMLYGVNNEEEIIFQETFNNVGIQPTVVVSQPSPAWGGERGRLSAELILGLAQPTEDALIYISGPEPMVEKLQKDLQHAGVKKQQLVLDFFPGYKLV